MNNLLNTVLHGDCLEKLRDIPNKSVDLICVDPPYNINKDTWDSIWGKTKKGFRPKETDLTEVDYYEWLGMVFKALNEKMKDSGSFWFFHNDFRALANLDIQIQNQTDLVFKNLIVWNKLFEGSNNYGWLHGYCEVEKLNNFQKMCEYILFYTRDNTWKLKAKREELNISGSIISQEILSKTGGRTGWYSNLETGKNQPTKNTIKPITKHLGLTLDDLVPKFRNQKTQHSVWNFDIEQKEYKHLTPKPVDLLSNIILYCTDPGDIVLDCFGGSGSLAIAALKTDRKFILIEKEQEYIDISNRRIEEFKLKKNLLG